MTPPKLAIAIDLDAFEALVREYIVEHEDISDDDTDGLYRRILLSTFILWLRKRQETSNVPTGPRRLQD